MTKKKTNNEKVKIYIDRAIADKIKEKITTNLLSREITRILQEFLKNSHKYIPFLPKRTEWDKQRRGKKNRIYGIFSIDKIVYDDFVSQYGKSYIVIDALLDLYLRDILKPEKEKNKKKPRLKMITNDKKAFFIDEKLYNKVEEKLNNEFTEYKRTIKDTVDIVVYLSVKTGLAREKLESIPGGNYFHTYDSKKYKERKKNKEGKKYFTKMKENIKSILMSPQTFDKLKEIAKDRNTNTISVLVSAFKKYLRDKKYEYRRKFEFLVLDGTILNDFCKH